MTLERKHTSSARRHSAIMFTDIVGYTSLMGSDEDRAFEVLAQNREIHTILIEQFNGTLIKEMGDGMLISFDLASDAVRCAIEIQKACKDQDIPLKIGIHEGEMVFEGNDVLGDGVNIAARLESETPSGCIFISGAVYNDIRNKVDIQTQFIEEKQFKNVHEKIKVYQVLCDVEDGNHHTKEKSKIEIKKPIIILSSMLLAVLAIVFVWLYFPSKRTIAEDKIIAVIPFINQSESNEYAYFGDALTDEIIMQLMKVKDFEVRSNTSVLKYKDSDKSIPEIGDELKVNYIIEGTAQRFEDNLRIRVQLIDANTDEHLWGDIYERKWSDVLVLQSEIAMEISSELQAVLSTEEVDDIEAIPTKNLKAYELYLKGKDYFSKEGNSNINIAIHYYKQAIALDQNFALAYVKLGVAYFSKNYWVDQWKESFGDSLLSCVNKALELDNNLPEAYLFKGYYFFYVKTNISETIKNAKYAIELRPNYGDAYMAIAECYKYKNDYVESIKNYKIALELKIGDYDIGNLLWSIGSTYMSIQDHENAESTYNMLQEVNAYSGYSGLGWFYLAMGDSTKADYITRKLCEIDSGFGCWSLLDDYYVRQGDYDKALKYKTMRRMELETNNKLEINQLHRDGYLLWKLGREEEAMIFFEKQIKYCKESIELKRPYATYGSAKYDLAGVYAFLDEKSKAYTILHEIENERFDGMLISYMKVDPLYENMWNDEEFKQIIERQEKYYSVIRAEIDQLEKEGKL